MKASGPSATASALLLELTWALVSGLSGIGVGDGVVRNN